MTDDRIFDRLAHLFPSAAEHDATLLESLWEKLDAALAHCRLDLGEEETASGTVRSVTALGVIRICVNAQAREMWGCAIAEDGSLHRIGPGLHAFRLLDVPRCGHWWLRFAFWRWARLTGAFDIVIDPMMRPSSIELATSAMLMRRLRHDPRFRTLPDEFDAAIDYPESLRTLLGEVRDGSYRVEHANEAWTMAWEVNAAVHRAMRNRS